MRYIIAAIILFASLIIPTFAFADGPADFREEARIERRIRAERAYTRELQRDYRQFRGSTRLQRLERELVEERRRARRYERRYAEPLIAPRRVSREERMAQRILEEDRRAAAARPRYAERDYREQDRRERVLSDRAERSRCMPSMTGLGVERMLERRARESALKQWGRQVEVQYGRSYVNPRNAINPRYVCDPYHATSISWQCKFRAAPCRGEF